MQRTLKNVFSSGVIEQHHAELEVEFHFLKCVFLLLGAYIYPQRIFHSPPNPFFPQFFISAHLTCQRPGMICNPSGSQILLDPSSPGHRQSSGLEAPEVEKGK